MTVPAVVVPAEKVAWAIPDVPEIDAEETTEPRLLLLTAKLTFVPTAMGSPLLSRTVALTTAVPPTVMLAGLAETETEAAASSSEISTVSVAEAPSTAAVTVTSPSILLAVSVRFMRPLEVTPGELIDAKAGESRVKETTLLPVTVCPLLLSRRAVIVAVSPVPIVDVVVERRIALTVSVSSVVVVSSVAESVVLPESESDPPCVPQPNSTATNRTKNNFMSFATKTLPSVYNAQYKT